METGSFHTYTEVLAANSRLSEFAQKVQVTGDTAVTDMQAEGEIEYRDGRVVTFAHDLSHNLAPEQLEAKFRLKAESLLKTSAAVLIPVFENLSEMSAADIGQIVRFKA